MKNIFKSLMLVAVVAMAFTACQKDNGEMDAVKEGTILTFTAGFEVDTRVSFTDENGDGTYDASFTAFNPNTYKGDRITFVVYDGEDYVTSKEVNIADDGKTATLVVKFDETLQPGNTIVAYLNYYYDSWYKKLMPYGNLSSQALKADGTIECVTAHTAPIVYGNQNSANITFGYENAFGKMTFVNNDDLTFDDAIKITLTSGENTYEYSLWNAANNKTVWFNCDLIAKVDYIKVSTYVDSEEYIFEKENPKNGTFAFTIGHISGFNVTLAKETRVQLDTPEVTYELVDGNLKFSWEPVDNATSYSVSYNDGDAIDTEERTYIVDANDLTPASTHSLKVVAKGGDQYLDSEAGFATYNVAVKLDAPTNVTATADGKTITVTWNEVANAAGYTIYVDGNYKWWVNETTFSYTFTAAAWDTTYEITVVASGNGSTYDDSDESVAVEVTTGKEPVREVVFTSAVATTAAYNYYDYLLTFSNDDLTVGVMLVTEGENYLLEKFYDYRWGDGFTDDHLGYVYSLGSWSDEYYTYYNAYATMDVKIVNDQFSITLSVWENGKEKTVATYVGDIEGLNYPSSGEEPENVTVVSAAAAKGTMANANDSNYRTVTFTLSNDKTVAIEFRTDDNDYLTLGEYTNDWSSYSGGTYPGYVNYAYYNGNDATWNHTTVSAAGSAYTIQFGVNGTDYTYTGTITGLVIPGADQANAVLYTGETFAGANPYDVTFTFATGEEVMLRFATLGEQYIHVGDWQANDWQSPHYVTLTQLNGKNLYLSSCKVSYAAGEYTVAMSLYDSDVPTTYNFEYVGVISGLNAPEECDCFVGDDNGDDNGDNGDGSIATTLNITRINYTPYPDDTEVHFFADNTDSWEIVIDMYTEKLTMPGTYSYEGGSYDGLCNYVTPQVNWPGNQKNMTECVVTLSINGSSRIWKVDFTLDGKDYTFTCTDTI